MESRIGEGQAKLAIRNALAESARLKLCLIETDLGLIETIAKTITSAIRAGGKVVFIGNGGSAADAQHLAAELVGRFLIERAAIPAIALTTNSSVLSALGNDYGFDTVYQRQVEALVGPLDVVVAISTSGNSNNILGAIQAALAKGAVCIGFTGQNGGKLAQMCSLCLKVPSNQTPRIQEAHITVGHIVCDLIETELYGPN
jgi:D-sedoheptulose 7-phosphate isomerase